MQKLVKLFKSISVLVLIGASLSIFAASVHHVSNGGTSFGFLTKPIKYLTIFPLKVIDVINAGIKNAPPTYINIDKSFQEINNLKEDVYGLNSFYIQKKNVWETRLFNFKNDSIIHKWELSEANFKKAKRQFANSIPLNSLLLKDRSLILFLHKTDNLYRLDKNSKIVWYNSAMRFHHSLNMASDGNIWICTEDTALVKSNDGKTRGYDDNFITKINTETGKVLFNKSVSEILIENGYKNFVLGFENDVNQGGKDPLHLNDIEPVLKDGKYWKEGDLLLSLRHRSAIILYRPETNKIIRLIYGPFLNQHDVDIFSETEISFFDNNTSAIGGPKLNKNNNEQNHLYEIDNSGLIIYNFDDSTYHSILEHQFESEKIYTKTQGLHTVLSNGNIYVESQNTGKMYILNENEILVKKYFHTGREDLVEQPHWLRIYEHINF